ncbi:hypothetical protein C8J57DRAFT_1468775 [Mycena rebaudengoi]|nr:hypothetical protein C8J57DRAFT_1468775 [Mycena rebaudengoi]
MKQGWHLLLFFPTTLASFIVNTITKKPSTCEPILLQWQGGIKPWTLRILAADGPAVLDNLGTFGVTSFRWSVDVAAGTSVVVQVQDSKGDIATSNAVVVQPGSTNCNLKSPEDSDDRKNPLSVDSTSDSPDRSDSDRSSSSTSGSSPPDTTAAQPSVTTVLSTSAPSSTLGIAPTPSRASATPPSNSLAAASVFQKRPVNIDMVFAILIPLLILLALLALWFLRRRRRWLAANPRFSELESQASSEWFPRPIYRASHDGSEQPEPLPRPPRSIPAPAEDSASNAPRPAVFSGTSTFFSPTSQSSSSDYSKSSAPHTEPAPGEVDALRLRIHALMEENAVLANMATIPLDTPPPAYT